MIWLKVSRPRCALSTLGMPYDGNPHIGRGNHDAAITRVGRRNDDVV